MLPKPYDRDRLTPDDFADLRPAMEKDDGALLNADDLRAGSGSPADNEADDRRRVSEDESPIFP